jgi:hypothetical protein
MAQIALDDRLLAEARSISKHLTKKAVVIEALQEYIQKRKQIKIINIFRTIEYEADYDYKAQRQVL